MGRLFSEFTPEKIEEIKSHPYFKGVVPAILERAEQNMASDPPRILFSQIHLFAVTGNRTVFEKVFNEYTGRMQNLFLAYLFTEDEKYIEPLADIIWNICDFESWSIPAHVGESLEPAARRYNLDLTSTMLGFQMAEMLHIIGDKLPDLVRRRAEYEIRVRIIDSYRDNRYWWMMADNNWSAVCVAATFAVYAYLATPEETEAQLDRMIATSECYLRGFEDDGCCKEGYAYWNYGFSNYCIFASMLREYTDGRIDLFRNPKVRAIAHFQENAAINRTESISFSDSGNEFLPTPGISHFLKHEYPDIAIPPIACQIDPSASLRTLFWMRPEYADCEMRPVSHIYSGNQWFIHRAPNYSIACKAGHNKEPHNHNDVGSFLISKNEKTTFTDPGGGEYTRQYFSAERYDLLACSSRGHSVPIINGENQVTGDTRATVFTEQEDEYAFSMEQAYEVKALEKLTRRFKCLSDRVEITDSYRFSEEPTSVVERFVSLKEITLTEGGAKCGDSLLTYDPEVVTATLTSEPLKRKTVTLEVYMLDLTVKDPKTELEVKVTIS